MKLVNEYYSVDNISKDEYRVLLQLLYPFAPHISEELNERNNLGEVICKSKWPTYDEKYLVEEVKTIAVQVNGKVRATIEISIDEEEDSIKEKSLNEENVKNHTAGKEIIKVIVVKGRIVNIVVK